MRWIYSVACIVKISRKVQKKEAIGRTRSRWENNIKILLREIGSGNVR
jgi:hypothetical protein